MSTRELKVNCPTCKEIVPWTDASPHRPFCSSRCKLIDFGEWASERNTIAGEPVIPDDEQDDYR
ncbi:MAG: DNA gyrase inhibitor YacG [Gammaproteobacteria bacterium]|nr:DNA gyrase inhibitor YacG [Gammaproteobacteria bacterium]MDP2140167.1 DNA gyrase inhibitor YacG [Gammaproteobacteria bacterium]MDP2348043.1 DNA gyrase inhibitor YacG [Gammaproteobacteria bacterium]